MVDAESLESSATFKPEHLGCITHIFGGTYYSIFYTWEIQKYKEIAEFIKKLRVCDMDFIPLEDLIIYDSLVKEAAHEYRNLVYSKWWELSTINEKYQDQPYLLRAYTVSIDQSVNKALKKVDFKNRHNVNGSGYGGGSPARSNLICRYCVNKGRLEKYWMSKGNDSRGNLSKNYNELPEWVTKNISVSYTKDMGKNHHDSQGQEVQVVHILKYW